MATLCFISVHLIGRIFYAIYLAACCVRISMSNGFKQWSKMEKEMVSWQRGTWFRKFRGNVLVLLD